MDKRFFLVAKICFEIELSCLPLKLASSEDKPLLEKAANIDSRLAWVYFLSAFAAGASYLIAPILKALYEIQTTGNATWVMPMRSV